MRTTSKQNAKIKAIRGLHGRKQRQQSGLFLLEGLHSVRAAMAHPDRLETVIVCYDLLRSADSRAALDSLPDNMRLIETSAAVFNSISTRQHPHGLAAVARQQWTPLDAITPDDGLWVALSGVQYPGNLGTILRTCDAVGAAGVILLGDATDPYHPTAVRAGLSAYFTQRIVAAQIDDFAARVAASGYGVIGASADGAVDYRCANYRLPLILLMGSEGHGLGAVERDLCDALVAIPMHGHNDSLNLSVATGVLLYEILACAGAA